MNSLWTGFSRWLYSGPSRASAEVSTSTGAESCSSNRSARSTSLVADAIHPTSSPAPAAPSAAASLPRSNTLPSHQFVENQLESLFEAIALRPRQRTVVLETADDHTW